MGIAANDFELFEVPPRFVQDRALATLIDERHDWPAAAAQVRALMFTTRFALDVERRQDALGACAFAPTSPPT